MTLLSLKVAWGLSGGHVTQTEAMIGSYDRADVNNFYFCFYTIFTTSPEINVLTQMRKWNFLVKSFQNPNEAKDDVIV